MERTIRLGQLARQINVGISTIAEFLCSKGIEAEANPNTTVDSYAMGLIQKEFGTYTAPFTFIKLNCDLKASERSVRLGKVAKQVNASISTIAKYLAKNGIEVKVKPETKLYEEAISLIYEKFSKSAYSKQGSAFFETEEKVQNRTYEIPKTRYGVSLKKIMFIGNLGKDIDRSEPKEVFFELNFDEEPDNPSKRKIKGFFRFIKTGIKLNKPKINKPKSTNHNKIDFIVPPYTFYTFPEEDAVSRLCKVSVSLNSI